MHFLHKVARPQIRLKDKNCKKNHKNKRNSNFQKHFEMGIATNFA